MGSLISGAGGRGAGTLQSVAAALKVIALSYFFTFFKALNSQHHKSKPICTVFTLNPKIHQHIKKESLSDWIDFFNGCVP